MIELMRKYTEANISIHKTGEISADFLGQDITMKDVTIAFGEHIYFVPELYANQNFYIEAKEVYPYLFNPETNELKIDTESLEFKRELLEYFIYAIFIYLHDHAKGVKQKVFYNLYKEKLEEMLNKAR
jgi:hypothetical protein